MDQIFVILRIRKLSNTIGKQCFPDKSKRVSSALLRKVVMCVGCEIPCDLYGIGNKGAWCVSMALGRTSLTISDWKNNCARELSTRKTYSGFHMSESWERRHLGCFFGRFVGMRDACAPSRGCTQLKTAIGSNLRRFRQQLRLTQSIFGQAFGGYSQRQITSYETGEIEIPMGLSYQFAIRGIHWKWYWEKAKLTLSTKLLAIFPRAGEFTKRPNV